jgi:hypothetical protein
MRPPPENKAKKQRVELYDRPDFITASDIKRSNDTTQQDVQKKPKVENDARTSDCTEKTIPFDLPYEVMEQHVGFCCYQCFCSYDNFSVEVKDLLENDPFIQAGENELYHRRCCHNSFEKYIDKNWMPPYQIAVEKMVENMTSDDEESTVEIVTPSDLKPIYNNAFTQLAKIYNNDSLPGKIIG